MRLNIGTNKYFELEGPTKQRARFHRSCVSIILVRVTNGRQQRRRDDSPSAGLVQCEWLKKTGGLSC
jgi:hypothetical protein